MSDAQTLAALRVAAAAPPELRARAERLFYGPGGVTLDLRGGPDLIFGSAGDAREQVDSRPRACSRTSPRPARPTSTCACPKVVAAGGVGPVEPEPTPTPTVVPSNPQP